MRYIAFYNTEEPGSQDQSLHSLLYEADGDDVIRMVTVDVEEGVFKIKALSIQDEGGPSLSDEPLGSLDALNTGVGDRGVFVEIGPRYFEASWNAARRTT